MAFQNQSNILILGDENGKHIILDGDNSSITLWVGPTIVGEISAPDNPFDLAWRMSIPGDSDARWYLRGDGAMFWGPGNGGQDVLLERDNPGRLRIQGGLFVDGQNAGEDLIVTLDTFLNGELTVGALAALQDLEVSGTLDVTGLSTVDDVDVNGTLDVVGQATFDDLTINGDGIGKGGKPILTGYADSVNVSLAVAATSKTQAVVFPAAFSATPNVHVNINSGDGSVSQWNSRAINVTTTGFTILMFGPSTTFTNIPVQWTAVVR